MKKNTIRINYQPLKSTKQVLFERMNIVSGMPLTEVDWEKDFSDVSKKCLEPNQLKEYLNKVVSNNQLNPKDREKLALDKPHIHAKSIPKDDEGEIDVEEFIKNITAMPSDILSINRKMEKSKTDNSFSVNMGIPALRGLVYDIDGKKFYVVNTCPGAGTCAVICYARRGSYVMFPNVFVKQTRVLNLLLNYPDRFEKLLKRELESVALKNPDKEIQFRWNDAGDFFTKKYFEIASRLTKELKTEGYNIKSYAYTKMGDVVNLEDSGVVVNFSNDANKRETGKIKDVAGSKQSVIVPKEIFNDLLIKDKTNRNFATNEKGKVMFNTDAGLDELKNRLAKKYGENKDSILSYDELMKTPVGDEKQYSVIVMPKGDGDVGAQREDVKTSFLLYH